MANRISIKKRQVFLMSFIPFLLGNIIALGIERQGTTAIRLL